VSESTTFEFIVAAEKLNAFGAELATLVESVGCGVEQEGASNLGELPQLLQSLAAGQRGQECLTLGFTADVALREFLAENPELRSQDPGKVAVGCFWLGCKRTEGKYSVQLTSATRSISSLMKESVSVQMAFRILAQRTNVGDVQVINEWNEVSVL
jgi:hypothetical protein